MLQARANEHELYFPITIYPVTSYYSEAAYYPINELLPRSSRSPGTAAQQPVPRPFLYLPPVTGHWSPVTAAQRP
jgi:hypothetical protein